MEKLIYLLSSPTAAPPNQELLSSLLTLGQHTLGLTVFTPLPTLRADEPPFRAVLSLWLACVDRQSALERALSDLRVRADGYLVTESLIHGPRRCGGEGTRASLVSLEQMPQLGQRELRVRLSALSGHLRRHAASPHITRDSVVRPLQASAPPLRVLFTFAHDAEHAGAAPSEELGPLFDSVGSPAPRSIQFCARHGVRLRGS